MRDLNLPFNSMGALWILALACAWLIPNHYDPWRAFHSDAWMTVAIILLAIWQISRYKTPVAWPLAGTVVLCVAVLPLLQNLAGMQYFAGDAWMASAYLFGFAVSIGCGSRWEQQRPGDCISALFWAFAIASFVSVLIQSAQWLRVDLAGLWQMPLSPGARPYANLAQPNQLATLLIWGLLSLWWAYQSGRARGSFVFVGTLLLLWGLAMAQSRTTWIALSLLTVCALIAPQRLLCRLRWSVVLGLAGIFIAMVVIWPSIDIETGHESARTLTEQFQGGRRPNGWSQLLDAVSRRPWTGYGWGQVVRAQFAVTLDHPPLYEAYHFSHNIVLDLLVWNGIPLGSILVVAIFAWFGAQIPHIRTTDGYFLLLAMITLGLHALVEYPHAYAYFLFPSGIMVGALSFMHAVGPLKLVGRGVSLVVVIMGVVLFSFVVKEYFDAEANLLRFRFEQRGLAKSNSEPPDLHLLTQLRGFLTFVRIKPRRSMSIEDLELMRKISELYPSGNLLLNYARAAALNGRVSQARDALQRLCQMSPPAICEATHSYWKNASEKIPEMALISPQAFIELDSRPAQTGQEMR